MSDKSIRTPLARAQGLGSAKEGTSHWWMARVTAVILVPLCFYLLTNASMFLPPPAELPELTAFIASPMTALILVLAIVMGIYHAMLGVEVIIEDYVHAHGWKFLCLILNKLFFLVTGTAAVYALAVIALSQTGK